ncbi:nuclear pore complex protein Nup93-1-like [Culicoides brevitarsis]|uniref:nuclear pore complex protein Nup93-1-like n=1 Tax=Culicoides brevitarsis TaxID=469753 RepID=UPI00307C6CE9
MDLNSILQQAQKLTNEQSLKEFNVERTLPQVLQATKELHNRVRTTQDFQNIQAHILLGSKGIDLPKISRKLEALSTQKTFEPLEPITDTDVESFLKNERENVTLSVIEEAHRNCVKKTHSQKWNCILTEWKHEKTKLMNALIGPSQNWIDFRKGSEPTALNEVRLKPCSSLNNQEMAYARIVQDYNKFVCEGVMRPSLVNMFAKAAETFNDPKISELWDLILCITDIPPMPKTQDPIKTRSEHQYLIIQARKYLENRYKLYMQTVSSQNLRAANRGGVPSTYNLVSSFVSVKFSTSNTSTIGLQDGLIDGRPTWAMVYYSLRCGDIQSALYCMKQIGSGNDDIIAILEENVKYPVQKNNVKLENQIKMIYKRQIRNSTDAYKRIVYCILGRCDINENHSEVAKTSDDFLWIQLSMIRRQSTTEDTDPETITFSNLQTMILEQFGEKHFNAAEQPLLYFKVLVLTGQFEAAIEFLSRSAQYKTHAIHIALALHELHLLGGPRSIQEPLLSIDIDDVTPMRRLNIARLIMMYVKKFEISDPNEAVQYFFFLRKFKDLKNRNLFLVCVSDLAIQCREYELIFGKIQINGMRSRGLIDLFETVEIDAKNCANLVAEELVQKGMFEDAVTLYDLAQNIEKAVLYISILLSQVVHHEKKSGSLKTRVTLKADELIIRYSSEKLTVDSKLIKTFDTLRQLGIFFDQYYEKNYESAIEILEGLNIIPLNSSQIEGSISNFKSMSGEVSRVFPEVLLAAMDILHKKYQTVKSKEINHLQNQGHERQLFFLREQAKAITNMAAMIPFRMPGDVNSRLVQTEILMN